MDIAEFLRHSTVLDWVVLFLTGVLVILALLTLVIARGKKPFFFVLGSAVIPLAGGLFSTFMKYQQLERAIALAGSVTTEMVDRAQAESWVISYIGVAGAIIIGLLGLIGVVTKGRTA